jgi:hypothetical protein
MTAMATVYAGQSCLGFILARGKTRLRSFHRRRKIRRIVSDATRRGGRNQRVGARR